MNFLFASISSWSLALTKSHKSFASSSRNWWNFPSTLFWKLEVVEMISEMIWRPRVCWASMISCYLAFHSPVLPLVIKLSFPLSSNSIFSMNRVTSSSTASLLSSRMTSSTVPIVYSIESTLYSSRAYCSSYSSLNWKASFSLLSSSLSLMPNC